MALFGEGSRSESSSIKAHSSDDVATIEGFEMPRVLTQVNVVGLVIRISARWSTEGGRLDYHVRDPPQEGRVGIVTARHEKVIRKDVVKMLERIRGRGGKSRNVVE